MHNYNVTYKFCQFVDHYTYYINYTGY